VRRETLRHKCSCYEDGEEVVEDHAERTPPVDVVA